MDTTSTLRQIVAALFQIDPDHVSGDLDLRTRLQNSIARGQLDAAIRRRLNITCPAVYTASTYAELEAAILGRPSDGPPLATGPFAADASRASKPQEANVFQTALPIDAIQCGVDIELPENLPVEADYWESDFYRLHFTSAEIAYCIAQLDSRQHFAARWCAKEALKKCDSAYLKVEMNRIEVSHDAAGRPGLALISAEGPTMLPVAISLSHSKSMAVAVVVRWSSRPADLSAGDGGSKPSTVVFKEPFKTPNSRSGKTGWFRRFFGA